MLNVKFKKMNINAKMPTKAYFDESGSGSGSGSGSRPISGSAGWDLYAIGRHIISPGDRKFIPIGIATSFNPDWVAIVKDRSGMANRGVDTAAGVIDSDFRGEWKVLLCNFGKEQVVIEHHQKIAQAIFLPVPTVEWEEVTELDESLRGDGMLGSSDTSHHDFEFDASHPQTMQEHPQTMQEHPQTKSDRDDFEFDASHPQTKSDRDDFEFKK